MEKILPSTLSFLSDLKNNNERDWFAKNRKRYDEARRNFERFVQELIEKISAFDPILKGLEAKSCMYRINRDIRFSSDKTIYKTHMGAFIVRGGKSNADRFSGYYFHVEPGNNSMFAGGAYMPPMPWLTAIRENIAVDGERFKKLISEKEFAGYFGSLDGEKLRSAPKGFPRDHPYIEFLRMKSFVAVRMINDAEVIRPQLLENVIKMSAAVKPMNDFLNDYQI